MKKKCLFALMLLMFASSAWAQSPSRLIVDIIYNGSSATVINPIANRGVEVTVNGAEVVVTTANSRYVNIEYRLTGNASNGFFKIYSDGDFILTLNGVQITNDLGPAINIQSRSTVSVRLASGTTNTLTDGTTYAASPNNEDQKAAFFSEGSLIFEGTGNLIINGRGSNQHGLASDDLIDVRNGNIRVASAVRDAIHTNEGYSQSGGSIDLYSTGGDGVDAGTGIVSVSGGTIDILIPDAGRDGLKSSSWLTIAGGDIELNVVGNRAKGINFPVVDLLGGSLAINTSGNVILQAAGSGFDPSYCTGIKADTQVLLDGCDVNISTIGTAGRGISCDGDIVIQSGSLNVNSIGGGGTYTNSSGVTDAYHGPCLNANGSASLLGGTINLFHSGSAGKGISVNGQLNVGTSKSAPQLGITTQGQRILVSAGNYSEAKAIKSDGRITVENGQITINSADDGIKSLDWIQINGGDLNISNSLEGIEAPNIYVSGGEIHARASNDVINATMGNDVQTDDGSILVVNGGYIYLTSTGGDGIDSNGRFTQNGGTILIHGPPNQPEVALDINGVTLINGGFLVTAQINSTHAATPSSASGQRVVVLRRTAALAANTVFNIQDLAGNSLVTFRPERNYSALHISSPSLTQGTSYRVYTGGSSTGTLRDGLFTGGIYTPGTLRTTFNSTSTVQTVNF